MLEYLNTPLGVELQHAVILLVLALAAYFARNAHVAASDAKERLDLHMDQHLLDVVSKTSDDATSSGLQHSVGQPTMEKP